MFCFWFLFFVGSFLSSFAIKLDWLSAFLICFLYVFLFSDHFYRNDMIACSNITVTKKKPLVALRKPWVVLILALRVLWKPWVTLSSALRVLKKPWKTLRSALRVLRKPRVTLGFFHYRSASDGHVYGYTVNCNYPLWNP